MKVLINCEQSGRVRDAFIERGHDAWSCDTEPTRSPGPHYQCDALEAMGKQDWDLMIAFPPCTYLTNSGVRWLHTDPRRWLSLFDAADFFAALLDAKETHGIKRVAIENPTQHKYARRLIGANPSQYIQPWQYGHPETKQTGLWLRGLPLLQPTNIVPGPYEGRIHSLPPSPDRAYLRSITYQGIADAMADQWGSTVAQAG